MHRSGTSFLVGSLQQHGLFLGRHRTYSKFNPRGNRENPEMWELQDEILGENGGSWDDPPASIEWRPQHFERARQIVAEYAGRPLWGFKDPRTLLTLDGWRALLPDLELVGIFRHPLQVAESLRLRDDMPREKALALWELYNRRLLEVHRDGPFPILSFDEEETVLQAKLLEVVEMLGLEPTAAGEPFFAEELRQAGAEEGSLPGKLEQLYDELRALAV